MKVTMKTFKIKGKNKAFFEILIKEIQDCKDMAEVNSLLDCWIKANDFHPENVQTSSEEELRRAI